MHTRAPRGGRAVGRALRRALGSRRRPTCSATRSRSPRATARGGRTCRTSSARPATSTPTPTASCSRCRSTGATLEEGEAFVPGLPRDARRPAARAAPRSWPRSPASTSPTRLLGPRPGARARRARGGRGGRRSRCSRSARAGVASGDAGSVVPLKARGDAPDRSPAGARGLKGSRAWTSRSRIYDSFTALDCVGPYDILSRLPGRARALARGAARPGARRRGPDRAGRRRRSPTCREPDVLLVPGGMRFPSQDEDPELLAWIASAHEHTTWTTSVCTGSLALGAAGILEGVPATSHWAAIDALTPVRRGADARPRRVRGQDRDRGGRLGGHRPRARAGERIADREYGRGDPARDRVRPRAAVRQRRRATSASDELRQRALEALLASQ